MTCAACLSDPVYNDVPRRCAFADGVFNPDNHNCATVASFRFMAAHGIAPGREELTVNNDDQRAAIIPLPWSYDGNLEPIDPSVSFVVIEWYKARGRTEGLWLLNETATPTPITLAEAVAIIDVWTETGLDERVLAIRTRAPLTPKQIEKMRRYASQYGATEKTVREIVAGGERIGEGIGWTDPSCRHFSPKTRLDLGGGDYKMDGQIHDYARVVTGRMSSSEPVPGHVHAMGYEERTRWEYGLGPGDPLPEGSILGDTDELERRIAASAKPCAEHGNLACGLCREEAAPKCEHGNAFCCGFCNEKRDDGDELVYLTADTEGVRQIGPAPGREERNPLSRAFAGLAAHFNAERGIQTFPVHIEPLVGEIPSFTGEIIEGENLDVLREWRDAVVSRANAAGRPPGDGLCDWFEDLVEQLEGTENALNYAERAKDQAQNQQTRLVQALAGVLGRQFTVLNRVPKPIGAMLIGLGVDPVGLPKEDADLLVHVAVKQLKKKNVDAAVLVAARELVAREGSE